MSSIPAHEDLQLIGLIALTAALAIRLESRLFGGAISGVVYALFGGLLLSNCRIAPFSAPAYEFVSGYLLVIAIPLLLMRANIRDVIREGGPVLKAFAIGAVGTVAGAWLGVRVIDLGTAEAKLAGMFTGTFTGGSVNFVSVSEIVELGDPGLFAAAVASDVVIGTMAILFLIAAPSVAVIRRVFDYAPARDPHPADSSRIQPAADQAIDLAGLALALAVASAIAAAGEWVAAVVGAPSMTLLVVTGLVLGFANLFPSTVARMRGDAETGLLMMYLFFVVIGLQADIGTIVVHGVAIVVFTSIVILMHFAFVLVGGRLFGLTLPEVLIGSSACVTGPAPALAQAASEGWHQLKAPAVLVGVFGYAIGTFIGVGVTKALS